MIPTIYIFKYGYRSFVFDNEESSSHRFVVGSISNDYLVSTTIINYRNYESLSFSKNPYDSDRN